MPTKLEEIEGRFAKEYFRRDSFMLGNIEHDGSTLTIKGECDPEEMHAGAAYRFYGKFETYKGERQFAFQTLVPIVAHDKHGIVEYLTRAGKGLGMAKGTALKLWQAFGADAVKAVRQSPAIIHDINSRITIEQCEIIGRILADQKATEDATIELTNLLAGRGFPKATTRKAIKKFGNKAAMIIRRDPFALMQFRGCGFKRCDALWIALGHRPDRLKRQALCAWYAVASNNDGHTWHAVDAVAAAVRASIGSANANPARAIKMAIRLGRVSPNHYGALAAIRATSDGSICNEGGSIWIAEGRKAQAERDLAEMIAINARTTDVMLWPDPSSVAGISDHQKSKLADALTKPIAILGGGPGTGKTYTTAMLIRAILASGMVGQNDIAIAAPTGKAAVRITEAMQAAGINLHARTWHSLLGVGKSDEDGGEWGFIHGRSNPWPYRLIVGDEESMKDMQLMCSVFKAMPRGCHFLLVGDVHQLPPVGNGAPLRDMIDSGVVGYGELTEIMRNSGGIVEACKAIREGNPWGEGNNLKIIELSNPDEQIAAAIRICSEARKSKLDPVWDCQTLVAVNARSPLSRRIINQELQSSLNPNPEIKGTPFRLDDKIVCLKNGRYPWVDDDDDEQYVANGELGKGIEIQEKCIIVDLSNPSRTIRVPRGKSSEDQPGGDDESSGAGCNWDLAYGLSCHKSQGSEWPIVIVIIDEYPGARMVCSREWLYTGMSRAKSMCYVIGKKSVADAMCKRVAIGNRKTFLRQLIQLENGKQLLEVM